MPSERAEGSGTPETVPAPASTQAPEHDQELGLPQHIPPDYSDTLFNALAFWRLQWSIFDDINDMQVMDDADDGSDSFVLRPYAGHPIQSQPATMIPMPHMSVTVDLFAEFDETDSLVDQEDCEIFREPALLVVQRPDGRRITVGDFVEQVRPYLLTNRDDIARCMALAWDMSEDPPPNAQYWFDGCKSPQTADYVRACAEHGEHPPPDEFDLDGSSLKFSVRFFRVTAHDSLEEHWRQIKRAIKPWAAEYQIPLPSPCDGSCIDPRERTDSREHCQ